MSDPRGEPADEFARSPARLLRALAGPGTGKTYALRQRVARLLDERCPPREILVVTFARTAARDLVDALAELGEPFASELPARTLHSFCFSILGHEQVLSALGRVPRILLDFEQDLMLRDLNGDFGDLKERRELRIAFEAAWARLQTEQPGEPVPGLDQSFQDALLGWLRWHRGMLVGEVVPIALSYLRQNPQADELRRFRHVIVDEYQDLNRAEQEVLELLAAHSNLAVIGDDDQSIYSFKWANPEGIREFDVRNPGTEDVAFSVCRRCPAEVVEMAQRLIERNPGRVRLPLVAFPGNPAAEIHHVQWRSIQAEAAGIARFVSEQTRQGRVEPGECLILAPSRRIGYAIRDALRAEAVPASSFFKEEAVSDVEAREVLTLLTLLADPADRVALRAWLGLGSNDGRTGAYRRLIAEAQCQNTDVAEVLRRVDRGELAIPHTWHILERWRELQRRLTELSPLTMSRESLIARLLPEGNESLLLLRETALGCIEQESLDLEDFVDALRYGVSLRELPAATTEVRVMSLHASKGLTADLVVMAGLVEGLMPSAPKPTLSFPEQKAHRQEQRRLFFVGLTRTRQVLVLSTYSQLDAATAHQSQVRRGRRVAGGAFSVFCEYSFGRAWPESSGGRSRRSLVQEAVGVSCLATYQAGPFLDRSQRHWSARASGRPSRCASEVRVIISASSPYRPHGVTCRVSGSITKRPASRA